MSKHSGKERRWRVTRVWRDVPAARATEALDRAKEGKHDHSFVRVEPVSVEQERRDLKADNPYLYAYIEAVVVARELERAGGDASGATDGYGAANRVWRLAGWWRQKAEMLRSTETGSGPRAKGLRPRLPDRSEPPS